MPPSLGKNDLISDIAREEKKKMKHSTTVTWKEGKRAHKGHKEIHPRRERERELRVSTQSDDVKEAMRRTGHTQQRVPPDVMHVDKEGRARDGAR